MQSAAISVDEPLSTEIDRVKTSLINLLLEVCPPILGCLRSRLQAALTAKLGAQIVRRFIIDQHVRCLIVGKEIDSSAARVSTTKDDGIVKEEDEGPVYTIFVTNDVDKRVVSCTSLAFIKRANINLVEDGTPGVEVEEQRVSESIGSKLQILNVGWLAEIEERNAQAESSQETTGTTVGSSSPFEAITNYLQLIADPVFLSQVQGTAPVTQDNTEEEGSTTTHINISTARKKLAEFIISVQQAEQNMEVPLVQLVVDPIVHDYIVKCKAENKKFSAEEFLTEISSPTILSQLQASVHKWAKDTQKVIRIDRDPRIGTASEEINFWISLERALLHIEQQLQSPDVEATISVLKSAKRFLASVSFEKETELRSKLDAVTNVNTLMKDFPLNDLLSANSIDQLTVATRNIFNHLKRLKSVLHYPFERAYNFVEAISRDLNSQLLKVLSSYRLLIVSFEEFDHIFSNCRELSRVWDEEVRRFKELIRDQIRKRGALNVLPPKLNCEHGALLERVEDIRRIRKQHQKLQDVIRRVLPNERRGESIANKEIAAAYNVFQSIDPLDITRAGTDNWESAKKQYNDKIDRVESQMTNKLRDRLGAAKTGVEMFRVFSQFNPLFFRPRIRGAIQEYQASLIQQVKDDLKALQMKYNERYERSSCSQVAIALDIPQLCGTIIWCRQLERKLQENLKRVEDVLGKGWEQHMEGQNLKQTGDEFSKKLNPQAIFDNWIKDIKDTKNIDSDTRIFGIKKHGGKCYELFVNYDPHIMFLFKEVRCLTAMGIRVPYSVKASSEDAKWIYPYLMTLQESIRTYTYTCCRLEDEKFTIIAPLVSRYKEDIQQLLQEGIELRWDYDKLNIFTTTLCNQVYLLESKLEDLQAHISTINDLVDSLRVVDYSSTGDSFKHTLEKIQEIISELSLSHYTNLEGFIMLLNQTIKDILVIRLEGLIDRWVEEFQLWPSSGTTLIERGSLHEFKLQNQRLYLFPPVEAARQNWISQFHLALGTLCRLPRLSLDVGTYSENEALHTSKGNILRMKEDRSYRYLMECISQDKLSYAYQTIQLVVTNLDNYIKDWLKYQYLWDIEVSSILSRLGDDLEVWQQLLGEIRASRSTFDTSEERKSFGPIVVDYATAQNKVMTKFEACLREILNVFGSKIFEQLSQFFLQLRHAKEELETQSDPTKLYFLTEHITGDHERTTELTGKVTQFVLKLQQAKQKESEWMQKIDHFSLSEKLLERQRYAFPSSWIWVDGVVNEWEVFQQLLRHLSSIFERHKSQLQTLVLNHDRYMQEQLTLLYAEWSRTRPIQGDTQPQFALQSITRMEGKMLLLREDYDRISQAKTALEMDMMVTDTTSVSSSGLTPELLEDELKNLKGVWSELKGLYHGLDTLKETPWSAVIPKKIRQGLTDLLSNIKKIPAKFRQYEAFEHLQNNVNDYLKMNMLLTDMRSDALKERHWKRLLEIMNLRSTMSLNDLTVGHLWESNLFRYESQIRDILSQAQGELALEEFLHMLRETWNDYDLELVVYKNRCKLIRGWDELFSLMDDHLNSIQSMKMSPYYKIFEEESNSWDDKLNRLRVLLDTWMEVQRRWVYLEGVFTGSADIQTLLPNEFTRFRSIDNDFLAIMKKTAGRPKILDVASTDGLQRSLDRLSDLLSKIQKALGEYLERQRLEFPRFYFVGDEDLLEMIGNSKDAKIVQRHLNKMFSGVSNFVSSESAPQDIIAMSSKEGECVPFTTSICIQDHSGLNSWLRACEKEMFNTIADLLTKAVNELSHITVTNKEKKDIFFQWIERYPSQIIMLSIQIDWTQLCEIALKHTSTETMLTDVVHRCVILLEILADQVLLETDKLRRLKFVQLITEVVHQRDVCRILLQEHTLSEKDFQWLQYMRFYWDSKQPIPTQRLYIRMANASFPYGFEYLGISEKLVQTPLTDQCYLTLTHALHLRLGGNPFGPAGTGKTETVKALGAQLGRFVLIFCCDETFDFQAMGRILVGLCQVGAWGCFDEFNRLEERILSACSEQILTIQTGLKSNKTEIELMNKNVRLHPTMGIFVTMNPGYAGRSNLPDNLKQLFREIAMINPDKVQITQVLLYSQGFQSAERLSGKVVALFDLCLQQLSTQPHYDFGLRSLKSVLSSAGNLKRESLTKIKDDQHVDDIDQLEKNILLRSICDTIVPKLIAQDVPLLRSLLQGVFPGADLLPVEEAVLEEEIRRLCQLRHFESRPAWMAKVLQLYQIQRLSHGVMLVGPVGTGKSAAWKILLDSMEHLDGIKGYSYILDAKSVPKEQLYGRLDPTTLEWTDGMFTGLLRKILYNPHGIGPKRHWIIFDGDVDPEWAENLNSVLDDNKLLTLPNGERLQIPSNVRLIFEVDSLKYATLATVSRCGMVWFSDDILQEDAIALHFLNDIRFGDADENFVQTTGPGISGAIAPGISIAPSRFASRHHVSFDNSLDTGLSMKPDVILETEAKVSWGDDELHLTNKDMIGSPNILQSPGLNPTFAHTGHIAHISGKQNESEMKIRKAAAEILLPYFELNGFVSKCLVQAAELPHIMEFTKIRVLESTFSLLRKFISQVVEYNDLHSGYGMDFNLLEKFITKGLIFAICWGGGGSMALIDRLEFCHRIAQLCTQIPLPSELNQDITLLDYEVRIEDGAWHHWRERVVSVEIEPQQVQDANLVIETIDTIRHRSVLAAWLEEKKPFILCGPPGSGKTMTLTSTLKGLADFDIASLNFSSGTTPELLLKTFDHYCEYVKTTSGMVLRPTQPGKWLIVFADEINLPEPDRYGTQKAIMFMRLMQEYSGFWKLTDKVGGQWTWVKMERIQFAGACNPPTDAGRHPMSNRFLRHAPLLFVDFPGSESLKQIYGTFNRALLRRIPNLRPLGDQLTIAMVEFYTASQKHFTVDQQPHYIYSPRELTRWKVALYEALNQRDHVELRELVRLYIHEGLRIFQDRLVEAIEKEWTDDTINTCALNHFPGCDQTMLQRPILYCCYLTRHYEETQREELRELIQSKLRVFNEEELNVQLVLFDQVLDHITRIDRVLRQPLGHLLLVGASGAGKTVLSKFVSWLNGLSVFQLKAGRNYDTVAFEADLRLVMKRAGLKDEKITFIFDESNALGPAFLERMNALLASGEVPGLFEGDDYSQLIAEAKQCYGSDTGKEDQDLFVRFTKQVQRNLHIVFTMNPANPDFSNRQATSPALFNRCVIDWFGDWPHEALLQVASEFTLPLELAPEKYTLPLKDEAQRRENLSHVIVSIHETVVGLNERLLKGGKKYNHLTPRDFLDFILHFISLVSEKEGETVDNTKHLNVGLLKLKETEQQVAELQESLAVKEVELHAKNKQAEEKMQLIIEQQAVAEERKKDAELLASNLDTKSTIIANRRQEVETELKLVEPLLREAESAVSNIPKRYLDELRAMANPPQMVKFAVEAIVVMLNNMGNAPTSWEECRKVLKSGDFINRVITFDSMTTSPVTVQRIKQKIIDTESWDVDKIMRASSAAGPLALWVQSSISFRVIAQKVDPLKKEIQELVQENEVNQKGLETTQLQILSLEQKLQNYKTEYAQLITDVQMIKQEIESVQHKVKRSSQLLKNLGSEKTRWSHASASSKDQLLTALGDCLLAAGFSTYVGFFEHGDRSKLYMEWKLLLQEGAIRFRSDLSIVDYLSKPSERFNWISHALPADDLSIENAIILQRYIRYPLIIDPSGQASTFLSNELSSRKLVKTSFIDPTFFKNLESALRFGTPLLVQDVEKVDPILNAVLNQETHKAGGRVLITVGDSDIDFSPLFKMFLTTRDPTAQFTPDLCSRVTFVNFTLTPSSLQNQCLNLVLKSERPDVDKKRSDVLKLQGEFRLRIRELEESLLFALSNVKGNILDDDNVITTLETLKAQAEEVAEEAARADEVMSEVEKTSGLYLPLSEAAARLFFTLQSMQALAFLYHYDLCFFESVFHDTLKDTGELSTTRIGDYSGRLEILFKLLFKNIFTRCAIGLMYQDRIILALQLARIRFESEFGIQFGGRDLSILLQGTAGSSWGVEPDTTSQQEVIRQQTIISPSNEYIQILGPLLSPEQIKSIQELLKIPSFSKLNQHIIDHPDQWVTFLNAIKPETCIPPGCLISTPLDIAEDNAFENSTDTQDTLRNQSKMVIREALLIKALRPDGLPSALIKIVDLIFGKDFLLIPEVSQDDLHRIVTKQLKATVPVILISSPGFDPGAKVLTFAKHINQHITSIAMGSEEGYTVADKTIISAARQGTWVLLKNVHLSSSWLVDLEKKLFRTHLHDNFRIFLTMELSQKVPRNLFRVSFVFLFEPPAGLRASLQRTYEYFLSQTKSDRQPIVARCRLHFLLAFLHAVILERKRYTPFGWSKHYEFSDADLLCAIEIIDQWLDAAASGHNFTTTDIIPETIDPGKIPFQALRTLLRDAVYGGRLDNEVDTRALASFIDHLFSPDAFESDFILAPGYKAMNSREFDILALPAPELGRSREFYTDYITSMNSIDEPLWLGLAPRADRLISARQGLEALGKWFVLHSKSAEELRDFLSSSVTTAAATKLMTRSKTGLERVGTLTTKLTRRLSGPVGWLAELQPRVITMLQTLPPGILSLERSEQAIQDPMFRCYDREVSTAAKLLDRIKTDLEQLNDVCNGISKFTNSTRELAKNVSSGTPPKEWLAAYKTPSEISLADWLLDFCKRVGQLVSIGKEYGGGFTQTDNADIQIQKYQQNVQTIVGALCPIINRRVVWFGGLQFPKAFLTATRQSVAQQLKRSLDDLDLVLKIGEKLTDNQSFIIAGVTLENASWDNQTHTLALTDTLIESLPPILLQWIPHQNNEALQKSKYGYVTVPMFLTKDRTEIASMVELPVQEKVPSVQWYQRGVALVLWHQI